MNSSSFSPSFSLHNLFSMSLSFSYLCSTPLSPLFICLIDSGHPYLPYLATSGLETAGKLWMPTGDHNQIDRYGSEESKELEVRHTIVLLFIYEYQHIPILIRYIHLVMTDRHLISCCFYRVLLSSSLKCAPSSHDV